MSYSKKTKNNLSKGCTTKEKHDIIYACFGTNYFCMILSGWVCAATLFEIIQNKFGKMIQNILVKFISYDNNKNKSLTFDMLSFRVLTN